MAENQPNTSGAEQPANGGATLVAALTELLDAAEFPQIRQVLGLRPSERFDPAPGYTLPDKAFEFFLTVFSTYRFGSERYRHAQPLEVVATPTVEELDALIRALTFYQPPYSPEHIPLEEFLFRFHLASETYTKPDGIHGILRLLSARVRAPVKHDIVLRYVLGRSESPLMVGLHEDLRRLVSVASGVELAN